MSKHARMACLVTLALLLVAPTIWAGEPLVVKTADGKFIPAVASEWVKAGDSFRFILKSGTKAADVAAELKDKIAPISVEATDDVTLVFKGADLSEQSLLEKLSGIQLGKEKARKDALAALTDLGDEGGPALNDLSSAGSIRASKKIELPKPEDRKKDPYNVVGKIVEMCPCEPIPTLKIRIVRIPKEGEHKGAFKKGKKVSVRGFYKIHDDSKKIDPSEERTKINLQTKDLKRGMLIFGKPFLKEKDVWILETIEKM
jgi:hypothetical protein